MLSHEIKNPLVSIGGFANRLKKKLSSNSPYMPYVDQIVKEVSRLEDIMRGIVSFSNNKFVEFSREDINSIVEEALFVFSDVLRRQGIKIDMNLDKKPAFVMGDRQQLKIAFDNLIVNAIQSMAKGGTLYITTYSTDEWNVVEVSDTGGGIDPQVIGNIFNPFFTTKEHGTGLGLAITYTIIKRHKGVIDVTNNIGVGVTFSVKLPHASRGPRGVKLSG